METENEKYPNRCTFFVSPKIENNEPMAETTFWNWLEKNKPPRFVEALKDYLKTQGFDITKHVLEEDQLANHKTTYEHFWWCFYNMKK